MQEIADDMDVSLIELIFPKEYKSYAKVNATIPELVRENEDLLEFNAKVEALFNFLTSFVPALEQMGFTKEKVTAQLDPEGKLESYTKERLKELKDSL